MKENKSAEAFQVISEFLETYRNQLHTCTKISDRIEKVREQGDDSLVHVNVSTTVVSVPKQIAIDMLEAALQNEKEYLAIKDLQLFNMRECLR